MVAIQLPPAASQARTREVVEKINDIIADTDGVADWVTLGSFSLLDSVNLSNAATVFLVWEDWDERGSELSQDVILADLRNKFAAVQDAVILTLIPPAIQGLGQAGGFEMVVQDRGDLGLSELQNTIHAMIAAGGGQSSLTGLGATFNADTPELFVDVDRTQAKTMGVPLNDVFGTLQTFLGSSYVNDFNKFGRTYQVRVQADYPFRLEVDDIKNLEVRNDKGEMVPLGALIDVERKLGAPIVTRYNLYPGASIYGSAAAGFSSGQALALMEQMAARELPAAMGYEWTGMSFQEKAVGNQAYFIFALAIVLVFLVLSAQYESWSAPAAVILAVPLALMGTLVALLIRQYDNNVYTQIGLVLLIALASKNAILIVEFARELRMGKGLSIVDSAVEAARLRFRPILMTSFAFILGVVPLLMATGAGAASQRAVGTTVFGGMLASTFLAVAFVPVFYVVMQRFSERGVKDKPAAGSMPDAGAEEPAE
jgi:HAE1 family hydrophobic/amphiphilic exporter-1